MRATRSSVKEWPLRDGPRPPGVGGSGARRVVGEKSRVYIARAADGARGRRLDCARVRASHARVYVVLYVHAYATRRDGGGAAGDNEGDERERMNKREKEGRKEETGNDGKRVKHENERTSGSENDGE